jgi:hypothetical protein
MSDVRRILVIANETCPGRRLADELRARAGSGATEVLIVAPALTGRLRHLFSDTDGALQRARERVDESVAALATQGVHARGEVGDEDPIMAIRDALATFPADELIISTHPPTRSHWLEKRVVEQARESFDVPVTHIVVDMQAEAATRSPASAQARS